MFPVGGVGVMLLGAALAGVVLAAVATLLTRVGRIGGAVAWTLAGLLWSLTVIGLVTLLPTHGAPGYVPADTRMSTCSFDYGGPAPDGFWIFASGQRLLNTALFVPSGALVALAAGAVGRRWPRRRRAVPTAILAGLVLLVAYSAGIELTQLELARLDRACDVTDVVDNATGALIGVVVGSLVVATARLLGALAGGRRGGRLAP